MTWLWDPSVSVTGHMTLFIYPLQLHLQPLVYLTSPSSLNILSFAYNLWYPCFSTGFTSQQRYTNRVDVLCRKTSPSPLLVCQLPNVYRTGKEISTYKRYAYNSDQNDSDLLADHTNAEILIILAMGMDFLRCQYDVIIQPARRSPKQLLYYEDISFSHSSILNYKGLACLIDKVVQSD